jgi:MFS transporter, YNFM family, putative membrane transport protein
MRIEWGTGAFWRASSALFVGGFVTFATLYCTQPLMPVFSEEFGVSPAVASLSLSVTTATLAVSMLVAAALSDSRGRKAIMAASLFCSAFLALLVAASPSFPTLLGLRALQGVVLAGLPSIAMAYVGEEFHPDGLGSAMGVYVGGTAIGGMSGRISTGVLADAYSPQVALAAIGAMGLLGAAWFSFGLPASKEFRSRPFAAGKLPRSFLRHTRDPGLLCIFGVGFLLMGSFVALYNYVGYLLVAPPYDLSQAAVGSIFVVYLAGTVSSAWMGRLSDHYGRRGVISLGVAIMLLSALLTLSGNLYALIAGVAFYTFGFFGAHSVASAWVGQRAVEDKAQASSLYLLFYYAGSSIVGSVGGLFWTPYGWQGVISMVAVLLLASLLLMGILPRSAPSREDGEEGQP